jgi:hypothetical protein
MSSGRSGQPEMMKHMTAHMRIGMMKGMEDSMAKCPMMRTMTPAQDAHSERRSDYPLYARADGGM